MAASPSPATPPPSTVTVAALLREARAVLAATGLDDPGREAAILVGHALGLDRLALLHHADRSVPDPAPFRALLARRAAREPMAFLLGHRGFRDLDLLVSPATLIPRPDTETLVEAALAHAPASTAAVSRILDLGTGTGCLLLAALSAYPDATGLGIDRSSAACRLARANAERAGLSDRAGFLCADWSAPLQGRFDLILCNPPYIPTADLDGLMPEVSRHEPRSALDGGADGLDCYRAILPGLPPLLSRGGIAVIELGQHQDRTVSALAVMSGLAPVALRADLGGIPRALVLRRAPGP